MVENNDRSTGAQNVGTGLSISDVSAGMLLDIDGSQFRVVDNPHVQGLSMARVTRTGLGELIEIDMDNDHAEMIFNDSTVTELKTYNPETHASVPRIALATAADELDMRPLTDELKHARDVIWDKLGYLDDR